MQTTTKAVVAVLALMVGTGSCLWSRSGYGECRKDHGISYCLEKVTQ